MSQTNYFYYSLTQIHVKIETRLQNHCINYFNPLSNQLAEKSSFSMLCEYFSVFTVLQKCSASEQFHIVDVASLIPACEMSDYLN